MGASANEHVEPAGSDEAARSSRFQALALPHLDAAYNLARWLSRNPGDADDIVQEAFLRAFRFFDTFRGDLARPWLLAIVRRVWYDEWRRRSTSEEVTPFDELRDDTPPEGWETASADPETLAIRAEDARIVQDALHRLPVEYREVLVLREMEDLSYREIAVIADLPVGTVMSRLARGRRRLAALLAVSQGRAPRDARPDVQPDMQADMQTARPGVRGNGADDGGGASDRARRPSVRGSVGRFAGEPAVDGGPQPHTDGHPDGPTTEAPDEL
ncbi:MAG: RNA polymerase sigma factor [Paraburkholderia sp.]|uniref:RNA polymerase sigma factor n=1 Tax=Paraburkholderia sp. TaxID=1926495 RepID=UPI00120ADA03|nr:RNA polymerase sigma factor [Paraburkholderia sp.]TAM00247.1 MAG: RNA polymerase sigma factor [Paraburkholderia sp.]TAM31247.1 MAG: RNA polymerase sigma factor [Paraburkholderia sp.]